MPFKAEQFKKYNEFIVKEEEEGVINVLFNNPKTLNAFTDSTWKQYREILEDLDRQEDVVVIIISLVIAKSFTLGLNLKSAIGSMTKYSDSADAEREAGLLSYIRDFQHAIATPSRIKVPTICVLNGIALGLAIDMALACTIRIATQDVKLLIREIKIGIPADMGSLQRMPAIVNNQSRLNELALTGAFFGADEAKELGFVSKVLPDHASAVKHAIALAEDIAGNQAWAVKATKQCIEFVNHGGSVKEGLENVAYINSKGIGKKFINAMKSVL